MFKKIWSKEYQGFESIYDLERDISEMWDDIDEDIPGEFLGTMKVTISYDPEEGATEKKICHN